VFSKRHRLIVLVIVLLMFLSLSIKPGFRVQQNNGASSLARRLFDQATLSNTRLHSRPQTERVEQDYLGIIEQYKRVIDADAERRYGDETLLEMARLCEEISTNLHKPRYCYNAIDYYKQLARDYQQSPHRALALITIAQIFGDRLGDREEEARAYAEVMRQYPNSVSAREASANIARITPAQDRQSETSITAQSNGYIEKAITSVRSFTGPDYARVVIDLSAPITYDKSMTDGNHLTLFARDSKLAPQLANRNLALSAEGLLKQVKAEPLTDGVRLNLECSQINNYAIYSLNNPDRLVIDLHRLGAGERASEAGRNAELQTGIDSGRSSNDKLSFLRALGLKISRIVIDPGHGGHDTGALSASGVIEKELVLDIGLRLRALLKKNLNDIDIIMTREGDRFIALEERTAIANARGADLFISIHANSSENAEASGVETYYLSINATKEELEVAARENASTARNARDLQTLLQQIVLDDKVIESRNFAKQVQRGLVSGLSPIDKAAANNRGVKKAPFIVLIGANMPSVLAEVSFLSNPDQASTLKTGEFRQQIAESLFDGIQRYIETLSNR
jgi:N-acetylmuramoyl-L-alanine amidase